MTLLFGIVLSLAVLAGLSIIVSTLRLGIGPLPTSGAVRRTMLGLCPEETTGTAYELGSGWGGLARALARRCPHTQVTGIEAAFVPWAFSAVMLKLAPLPNLRFVRGSFFEHDLSQARLAVCYLFTGAMTRLEPLLPVSTTVVTSTFALPGRQADVTVRADDLYRTPVYRYRH